MPSLLRGGSCCRSWCDAIGRSAPVCRPNAVDNEKIFPLQGCSERWLHLFEEVCPDDVEHVLRHEACEREPRPDPVQQGVVCSQMRGRERRPAARPGPVTPQQCAQSDRQLLDVFSPSHGASVRVTVPLPNVSPVKGHTVLPTDLYPYLQQGVGQAGVRAFGLNMCDGKGQGKRNGTGIRVPLRCGHAPNASRSHRRWGARTWSKSPGGMCHRGKT